MQQDHHQPQRALPHMPQLDGVRALAVVAVLVHHFGGPLPLSLNQVWWGSLGVRLFFVLSGFLITRILLRSRQLAEESDGSRLGATWQFYVRRSLRIFPIYYLVIAICAAINIPPVRELLGWLVTYTLNIQCTLQGWYPDNISHFWSLAVEEQFYLVWPWLVLFAPRKWLAPLTCTTVFAGLVFRLAMVATGDLWMAGYVLPFSALDALGLGALLAISVSSKFSQPFLRVFFASYALPVSVIGYALLLLFWYAGLESLEYYSALSDTTSALFFVWLVSCAARGFRGPVGALLQSRPFMYCGKISYGIYVYHMFAPTVIVKTLWLFGANYSAHGWLDFGLVTAVTIVLASLSWYLFEQPISSLKRYFSYNAMTVSRARKETVGELVDPIPNEALRFVPTPD